MCLDLLLTDRISFLEWKYQKKNITSGLFCKLVQSSSQERLNQVDAVVSVTTEKRVCTAFVNQWAASGEKQDDERYGQPGVWGILRTMRAELFLTFCSL